VELTAENATDRRIVCKKGKTTIAVPDTYTGAMMLHKRLNALACRDRDDGDFTLEHLTRPL
jgi:hypothetical protein